MMPLVSALGTWWTFISASDQQAITEAQITSANLTRCLCSQQDCANILQNTQKTRLRHKAHSSICVQERQPASPGHGDFALRNAKNARQWRAFAHWRSVS